MRLLPASRATFGRHLDRRIVMLRNLVSNLILKEQIITTYGRARAMRPIAEMLIRNARENTPELRTEAQEWLVDHQKTIPLLWGPLRARYQAKEAGFTRIFQLPPRRRDKAEMAVIELVDGPRDTLRNLERFEDELAEVKRKRKDLLQTHPDELIPETRWLSKPRPKKEHYIALQKKQEKMVDEQKLRAGRVKAKYLMTVFAENAIGKPLPKEFPKELEFIR